MGGRLRADGQRSDRPAGAAQSRQASDPRPDAAPVDFDFRLQRGRDARDVGGLRRRVDTAGLSCRMRAVRARLGKESALTGDDVRIIAGLGALVFAVNLVTIKYRSREARMYPLMLAVILAQVAMFIRALRVGGLASYAALVLTAIAVASNFVAMLVPATEGVWLVNVARARRRPDHANARRGGRCAGARGGRIDFPTETFFFLSRVLRASHRMVEAARQTRPSGYSIRQPAASRSQSSRRSGFGARSADGAVARATLSPSRCSGWGAADDDADVVHAEAGLRRVLRAGVLRSVFHSRRAGHIRAARRSRQGRGASAHNRHSPSAISFRTIASRTTRSIARQLQRRFPRSNQAR